MFIVPLTRHPRAFARSVDRFFDDAVFDRVFTLASTRTAARSPALDVAETDRDYTVTLDLPGVAKEQIEVSIDGRVVTVKARAAVDAPKPDAPTQEAAPKAADRIVYRERRPAQFERSIELPVDLDADASGARLEHGVLTLTLVKRVPDGARQLTIN